MRASVRGRSDSPSTRLHGLSSPLPPPPPMQGAGGRVLVAHSWQARRAHLPDDPQVQQEAAAEQRRLPHKGGNERTKVHTGAMHDISAGK